MGDWYWSWILSAVGLLGFFLAGSKVWWAWYVNIFNQVIWTVYAIATEQWGFLVGTAFYFVVFIRNAVKWTKEHRAAKLFIEYPPTEDQKPNQKILLKGE